MLFDNSKPLIQLVIFDLDGVFIDLSSFFDALREAAREYDLPPQKVDRYITRVRHGESDGIMDPNLLIKTLWDLDADNVAIIHDLLTKNIAAKKEVLISRSVEVFDILQERDIPFALCTNNHADVIFTRLENAGIDSEIFCDIKHLGNMKPKPHPEGIQSICAKQKVGVESVLFIGDWFPDACAARSASVRFAAVQTGDIHPDAFVRWGVPREDVFANVNAVIETAADTGALDYYQFFMHKAA